MFLELFAAFVFVLDVVAVIKVLAGQGTTTHKVFWCLAILLFPVLGAVLYFLLGETRQDARLMGDPRRWGHGSR